MPVLPAIIRDSEASYSFYLGGDLNRGKIPGKIDEGADNRRGWSFGTAAFRAADGKFGLLSSGAAMEKRRIQYNAGDYPYIGIKVLSLPDKLPAGWFQVSYSVNSAPEYWKLEREQAIRVEKDIYIYDIRKILSNNGTPFSNREVSVTLLLNFGETNGVPVEIDWIRSESTPDALLKEADQFL
ncbi:MAG: hypothetical protein LUE93_06140 [Bacteroides sp.]|nr:hypothetical protein [Bacteroides sp.]